MGYSKLQWFFFAFVIPLIFALIVYSVIITFMGKSIVDQVKTVGSHIPIVSNLFDEEKADRADAQESKKLEQEITRLTHTITEQEQNILALENKLLEKDEEVIKAKETIVKLEKQLENASEDGTVTSNEVKETAKRLLAMSPKDAALILAEMQNQEAISILQAMKPDDSGQILAKLEPKQASILMTDLLAEN